MREKGRPQAPFGPSVASLCHPWFTTTNLSYRFPIFETSATALCGTTGMKTLWYIGWRSILLNAKIPTSWDSKKHDERKYIPRSYHPCSHLESGGFLSHGGTPKSSMLFSDFPWNKPTSFWGSPMIMDPPTLPLPWLGTAPLGRPLTAAQIDVWIIPAIQPKSSTYLGTSSSFILIVDR